MNHSLKISFGAMVLVGVLLVGQSASSRPVPAKVQRLTYENVVSHFKDAGLRATEVQKRCTVFFEGEWKNADVYNYCLIIVENSDEDIQVTFYLTDAHEMNWVTEFLDAPFFAQAETKSFSVLSIPGVMSRGKKLGDSASITTNGSRATRRFSSSALPHVEGNAADGILLHGQTKRSHGGNV